MWQNCKYSKMVSFDNISGAQRLLSVLKWIGLWQTRNLNEEKQHRFPLWVNFFEHYYRYLLHVPLTFTFITLMWIEIFKAQSLEQASDVVYMVLTETTLIVKMCNIWWRRQKAWQYMYEVANSSEYKLHTQCERALWRRAQNRFLRIAVCYIAFSLTVVASSSLGVLFLTAYELPFMYWVPFDWRTARNYWYAYAYEMFAMPLTCIANTTLDLLTCYFMFHLAQLYKLLGLRMASLRHMTEQQMLTKLRNICRLHQDIGRLRHDCETLVSAPVLSQIVLSALILCFSGYRLQQLHITENIGQFFSMLLFLAAMTLEIFLPCYYANEVTIHSDHLTTSIYSCDWLQYSASTRRFIVTFMEILKRPAKIKAANFFEVGLPIFTKTMNNAYTFFAVLLNMDDK